MQRAEKGIQGSCFWDASSAANNVDGYRDALAEGIYRYPSLMPLSPFIDDKAPAKVGGVKLMEDENGWMLVWLKGKENNDEDIMNVPYRYVVYCFKKNEAVDIRKAENIVHMTALPFYRIPASLEGEYTFVVTVLDRLQNESAGVKCKVKL
mgnify:CR=1 FL=1